MWKTHLWGKRIFLKITCKRKQYICCDACNQWVTCKTTSWFVSIWQAVSSRPLGEQLGLDNNLNTSISFLCILMFPQCDQCSKSRMSVHINIYLHKKGELFTSQSSSYTVAMCRYYDKFGIWSKLGLWFLQKNLTDELTYLQF